jgi:hypothetical protein
MEGARDDTAQRGGRRTHDRRMSHRHPVGPLSTNLLALHRADRNRYSDHNDDVPVPTARRSEGRAQANIFGRVVMIDDRTRTRSVV